MKLLRYFLVILLLLVVMGGVFGAFIHFRGLPELEHQALDIKIEYTPERIAEGERIVRMRCMDCHYNSESKQLSGQKLLDVPKEFGAAYSQNITQDSVYGIGGWSDGELVSFLRTGIRPNGKPVPPYMPLAVTMSDEDLASVVSFLRSDHSMVSGTQTEPPASEHSWLVKMLFFVGAFKTYALPTEEIAAPDTGDAVAWGGYLVNSLLDCYACHSADLTKLDVANPIQSFGYLGGGTALLNREGEEVLSPNITMDKETGIGDWTEEEFLQTLKYGSRPSGKPVLYPMPVLSDLTDSEVHAIWEYLKTIEPVVNKVGE